MGRERNQTPRATRSPKIKEIYWAAGFYEGEGFACHTGVSEQISAVQVNKEPLLYLQELFGGSVRLQNPKTANPIWRWRLCGARARGFAMTIYSLLSKKRQGQLRQHGLLGGTYV